MMAAAISTLAPDLSRFSLPPSVRLSVWVHFQLQWQRTKWGLAHLHAKLNSASGTQGGGCISRLMAFMSAAFSLLLPRSLALCSPQVLGEKAHLFLVTQVKREPICHVTCREWTCQTAFQQALLVCFIYWGTSVI